VGAVAFSMLLLAKALFGVYHMAMRALFDVISSNPLPNKDKQGSSSGNISIGVDCEGGTLDSEPLVDHRVERRGMHLLSDRATSAP
jgi:hypothetical protein